MKPAPGAETEGDRAGEGVAAAVDACPHCLKPRPVCVCETITPVETRTKVLILQHPQEQDELLGTARVLTRHLPQATFRIGLSWPSLAKALGRPADPRRWAVLYLGPAGEAPPSRDVTLYAGDGAAINDQEEALADLEGVVLLDGSWSQAKTLWWRNPWVLKAKRAVINPPNPSLYGKLRREPRRDGLSTLEAAAFLLSRLEDRPEIERGMLSSFRRMLQRYRDWAAAAEAAAPASKRARRAR